MIGAKMRDAMNEQIKHELESYYIYLSMAAFFHAQNLDGMAHWMRSQAHEEMVHAMKFFDHLYDRGDAVTLKDLKQLKTAWNSPLEAFEDAYEHEQFVTDKIHSLMKTARDESDYAAETLLSWFVAEQIEEEASTLKVVEQLKMIGDSKNALMMIDRELAGRAFTPGSPLDPTAYQAGG